MRRWLDATPFDRKLALAPAIKRIRAGDAELHAWVHVAPQAPLGDGPLSGIPVGVKDIFETEGLPTEYGSEIYKGRIGTSDAAIVRTLRQRGAIVIGKTHTAAFAYRTPAATRNPRNLAHTPGGSSSGSAAAVAAGMVPLALGTQTKGSVLRPASYCGITGFKPTFGLISTEGVLPFSRSLDTVGFFTHTPEDMSVLWKSLGYATDGVKHMVVGVVRETPADPVMGTAFSKAIAHLGSHIQIQDVDLTALLAETSDAAELVMFYEAAQVHGERYDTYGDRLNDVADAVRRGRSISSAQYADALQRLLVYRAQIARVFARTPVIATPAATGPAPAGLSSTGDPGMNAPWTALGTPAISVPMPVGDGLPLGLQLTAAVGDDAGLLDTACGVYAALHGMLRT